MGSPGTRPTHGMSEACIPGLVSTIIPVYNRARMLGEAVNSVLSQSYRQIEIIISDDGSTDDTAAHAASLVERFPGVIQYTRGPNRGPGPAREAGRLLASGEFIQYLDSDDRLLPDKFELQLAVLRSHPQCDIAFGKTRLVDADGRELAAPFKWTGEYRDALFPGLLVDRWWCTHTPLYRRRIVDAIGPWSDLRYSQDWEYDSRAGALSAKVINCGEYVSEHRWHPGSRQTGSGHWLAPRDRVRFLESLFQHACRAGVDRSAPEFRHFARWVFRNARECSRLGDGQAARQLCDLTLLAQGGDSLELRVYRGLAALVGWQRAAKVSERVRSWTGRTSGPETRKQSWMR